MSAATTPYDPRRPMLAEQLWSDMDARDRANWFDANGAALAEACDRLALALALFGEVIKRTGAHEARSFSAERYVNDMLSENTACLAEEARIYLGL